MAAKKPSAESAAASDRKQSLVDRFEQQGAKQINPDLHFYKMSADNPIAGIVLERRPRPIKEGEKAGFYYVFGLTEPCTLTTGDGDAVEGEPGMFAWVDERWCLQGLQSYLPVTEMREGAQTIVSVNEVLVIPTKKVDMKGGRSVWRAEVRARSMQPRADTPLIAPKANRPPPQLSAEDQEDIPF